MARHDNISDEKRQQWLAVIESDPELFLAMAERTPAGRKILEAISRQDTQQAEAQAHTVNSASRAVSQHEAYEALTTLDASEYSRFRQRFNDHADDHIQSQDTLPLAEMVTLIEYARQQVTLNNPDLYVLQDSRENPDNQMLFWAKDAAGYTTDITRAHRFTEREAQAQQATRSTDIPHRVGDLNPATGQMLDQAALGMARLEREVREAADPLVIPRPRGVNLAVKDDLHNYGEHAAATHDLKALFQRDQAHADDKVVLAALMESPDKLETVLINPDEYQVERLAMNRDLLFRVTTLADFAASYWCHPDAHKAMPYNSWEQLTEFVEPHLKDIHDTRAKVPAQMARDLPTDLPPALASQRLNILDSLPSPDNLKAKLALADIEMASLYGEPVTEHLFTDTQNLQSWHDEVRNADLDTLYSKAADLEFMHQELTRDIRTKADDGEAVSTDDRYTLAMLKQNENEVERKIESVQSASYRQSLQVSSTQDDPDEDNAPGMR